MASEKGIEIRDLLNELIESLMAQNDYDGHVLSCCLAVSVSEIEKWLFGGEFTPSVVPFREGIEWNMPCKEDEKGQAFTGPAWARQKVDVVGRSSILSSLKGNGEPIRNPNIHKIKSSGLRKFNVTEWTPEFKHAFQTANYTMCSIIISELFPDSDNVDIDIYMSREKNNYSHSWGSKCHQLQNLTLPGRIKYS